MAGFTPRFSVNAKCRENNCPPSGCPQCMGGTMPTTMIVTVAGVINQNCGACASLNGTYILTRRANCSWTLQIAGSCGAPNWLLTLAIGSGYVDFNISGNTGLGPELYDWSLPIQQPINCKFSAQALTYDASRSNVPNPSSCNTTTSTVSVTAGATIDDTHQAGCAPCCGPDCTILNDRFLRADGPPGGNWSVVSGSWSIVSQALVGSGASATILGTPPAPYGALWTRVAIKGNAGDVGSIVLDYNANVAGTPYLRADFTYDLGGTDSGTVKLYQVSAGISSLKASGAITLPIGQWTVVVACYMAGDLFAAGTPKQPRLASSSTAVGGNGNGYGMGTPAAGASAAQYRDFLASDVGGDCPECGIALPCQACKGRSPDAFMVHIPAMSNNSSLWSPPCGCDAIAGEYEIIYADSVTDCCIESGASVSQFNYCVPTPCHYAGSYKAAKGSSTCVLNIDLWIWPTYKNDDWTSCVTPYPAFPNTQACVLKVGFGSSRLGQPSGSLYAFFAVPLDAASGLINCCNFKNAQSSLAYQAQGPGICSSFSVGNCVEYIPACLPTATPNKVYLTAVCEPS